MMEVDECNNYVKGRKRQTGLNSTGEAIKWEMIFTRIYTTVGILFGLLWIVLGFYIDNADVIEHFKDVDENEVNEAAIIDIEDFERTSTFLFWVGIVILVFSVFGHLMTFLKYKTGMVIFCVYLLFSFVGTIVVGKGWLLLFRISIHIFQVVLKNGKKIMEKLDQDSIRFWKMAVHPLSPIDKLIRRYEEDHNCCGWNNAIDYCDQKAVENLMKSVIDEGVTEKIIKYKTVNDSSFGNDDYFEDYYNYNEYTETDECTDDGEYDGDESCICNTISNFHDEKVNYAIDVVKSTVCVHQTSLCFYVDDTECYSSLTMPWHFTLNVTRNVKLENVCHEKTCFLNGCGDIFSAFFRKKLIGWLFALGVASGVFYLGGMAISINLTYKIWSIDQQYLTTKAKEKINARKVIFRNKLGSSRGASVRRTDGEEMPLNANS